MEIRVLRYFLEIAREENMTRDVLVTISGLQVMQQESGVEPVDLITAGDYYKKNDKHYVIFVFFLEG